MRQESAHAAKTPSVLAEGPREAEGTETPEEESLGVGTGAVKAVTADEGGKGRERTAAGADDALDEVGGSGG